MNTNSMMNTKEIAEFLGLSTATIKEYRKREVNRIPFIKLSERSIRYDIFAINRWLLSLESENNNKKKSEVK